MKPHYKGARSIALNASYLYFSQTVGSILRAFYTILIARVLGPELYGYFNYGLSWYLAFLALASFYLEGYMSKKVSLEPAKTQSSLSETFSLRLLTIAFALALSVLFAYYFESNEKLLLLLQIFSVALVGRSLSMWCQSVFVASEKSKQYLLLDLSVRVIEITIGLILLSINFGILALAILHAICWWLQATVGFILVRNKVSPFGLFLRYAELSKLFLKLSPFALASLSITWLMQGPLVMFRHLDKADVLLGQLSLVLQIFFLIGTLPASVGQAALPVLNRSIKRQDQKDVMYLEVTLRICIFVSTLIAIGAMAFGYTIITFVFGDKYLLAGEYIYHGIWLLLPFSVGMIVNQLLIAHEQKKWSFFSAVSGSLFLTTSVLLFGENLSVVAYIWTIFISMALWSTLSLKGIFQTVSADIYLSFIRPLIAAVISVLIFSLSINMGVFISILLAYAFLASSIYFLKLYRNTELDFIQSIWKP